MAEQASRAPWLLALTRGNTRRLEVSPSTTSWSTVQVREVEVGLADTRHSAVIELPSSTPPLPPTSRSLTCV